MIIQRLALLVADVLFLSRVKYEVADRSNKTIDTEGNYCEEEVSTGSGSETFGLKGSVVDDKATDPTEEKC